MISTLTTLPTSHASAVASHFQTALPQLPLSRTSARGHCRFSLQGRCNALPDYKVARLLVEDAITADTRFPWLDKFEVDHDLLLDADTITATLGPLFTDDRLARIKSVGARRTFNVLPIVEHPHDMGNLAAMCRTADALGFGAVHVINDDACFKQSARTSAGSDKWLDVQLHSSTLDCLEQVRKFGFRVVAADLRSDAITPGELDWTKPTAVVFGSELGGVSEAVVHAADAFIGLPMDGFVESFNVSVAAALILWEARRVRIERLGRHGDMTDEEQRIWRAVMLMRAKGVSRQLVSQLLRRKPPKWQCHRNGGVWYGKEEEFAAEEHNGVEVNADSKAMQSKQCHFWDGRICWAERVLFPHRRCRYNAAHNVGINTLDEAKLAHECERMGVQFPDLLEESRDESESDEFEADELREVANSIEETCRLLADAAADIR